MMMLLQPKQLSVFGCSGSKGGFSLATVITVALKVTFTLKQCERVKFASRDIFSA